MNAQRRTSVLFLIMTIILLLIVLMLVSDNNRKYAEALNQAATVIWRTQRAIMNELATDEAAASRAVATGLPMTQTRAAQPSTPSPAG